MMYGFREEKSLRFRLAGYLKALTALLLAKFDGGPAGLSNGLGV